ncbi:MAG: DNA translocase FtsK [Deltaproteobacteria bacterium]|nr:DNA translocase FtsK [Deltaproteobacteria bacterium]
MVDGLASAFYLPGTHLLLGVGLVLTLLAATGLSIRDAVTLLRRGTRRVLRTVGQVAVVSFVRTRRRIERGLEARREARREVDAVAGEPSAAAVPRAAPTLPRRRPDGDPEVVEHPPAQVPARQQALPFQDETPAGPKGPYKLPDLDLLAQGSEGDRNVDRDLLIKNSRVLEKKLADFGVLGRVVKVHPGPVITMYEFEPAPGVKVSRIVNLSDDLALALRAMAVRIVAPIPGKSVVGVEVPNTAREVVVLRDLLSHPSYSEPASKLTLVLGKDIFGAPVTADLAAMPHLLVAGATGSGKSVFLNTILCSLFYKATPDEVKLLLIDPKMLEFSMYQGIPHLITDVVTDPKRAAAALMGVVHKMEQRYKLMSERGVRNIAQYNRLLRKERGQARSEDGQPLEPLPYIVVVIDELADLMIVAARDVEESLMRLAQMARAAGIHLVLATQRPSVDVLTGIIKANFPSRIAFQVSSRTDSRTVLDANGAERLLGQGDMLFIPPGVSRLERLHGAFVSDKEIQLLCDSLRAQGEPEFDETLIRLKEESDRKEARGGDYDELFDEAVDVIARHRIASISFIQRKLKIGYNRSARLVEQMEADGIVGPQEGTKAREIFVRPVEEEQA